MYLKAGKTIYEIAGKPAITWLKKFLENNPSAKVISNPTKAQIEKAKTVTSPPKGLTEAQKAARSRASQQEFLKAEKPARARQERIKDASFWRRVDKETKEDEAFEALRSIVGQGKKAAGTQKKRRTKGIKKQSGETGEGLTEAQKAARSRESQQKFLKAEKPARKRQEGIQSARQDRRLKEIEGDVDRWGDVDIVDPNVPTRKKGGKVGKKKQGYKARKDESIAQRVKKKRTPKQLAASRDESYGKWGKGKGKGKINHADGNKLIASLYD